MADKIKLLFVDDEEEFLEYMAKRLKARDLDVISFSHPLTALKETENQTFDVGLFDLKMPDMEGEELLRHYKARDSRMEVVILTGHGTIDSAKRATRDGAYEYLQKPCEFEEVLAAITNAYSKRIKTISEETARKVNDLMTKAMSMSSIELLDELKKLDS